uniref:Trigger factor-like protein TIG, Chloroplastic n=1 Tax=Tanacetum cinerariifolium TaxID=118510 RepID=A0A6L2KRY9_TANCI|nr:trigger factor-like protein TIG, Chloroplastic [Tanacetum cinerariifolium]
MHHRSLHLGDLDMIEDKVDNPSPQSTPKVFPSFEVYTPPVTYPKEVDESIGILIEVEPLDHTKLEDLGLNTCSHDLCLSFREIPSVDESEPQLLPNFSPLDVNLGDKRGTDPPINPYSSGNFRIKVVKPLIIHTPPSPHVAYFHRNAPVVNWVPEDGYKNLMIVAELDSEINAKTGADREFTRRYKSLSITRIVTNRGLQVFHVLKKQFNLLAHGKKSWASAMVSRDSRECGKAAYGAE